ncbi:MAG: hypothetical protein OHK005_06540 [Candidatus Methylacidiphilales bacterium]
MSFWTPNLGKTGRILRASTGSFLVLGGILNLVFTGSLWISLIFWGIGLFCLAEAAGAWCIVRACGIKTRW